MAASLIYPLYLDFGFCKFYSSMRNLLFKNNIYHLKLHVRTFLLFLVFFELKKVTLSAMFFSGGVWG